MRRQVVNGETLSGHNTVPVPFEEIMRIAQTPSAFPEIAVHDSEGALMFAIVGFHSARVSVGEHATELVFENQTCVTVTKGTVTYSDDAYYVNDKIEYLEE
jgi:hypothetical protein